MRLLPSVSAPYALPLVFRLAVPMAWSGAILAHGLFGLPLSMESLVGMVAASGVVVNDSMVLLDYIHEHKQRSQDKFGLIAAACTARFRPIFSGVFDQLRGLLNLAGNQRTGPVSGADDCVAGRRSDVRHGRQPVADACMLCGIAGFLCTCGRLRQVLCRAKKNSRLNMKPGKA